MTNTRHRTTPPSTGVVDRGRLRSWLKRFDEYTLWAFNAPTYRTTRPRASRT